MKKLSPTTSLDDAIRRIADKDAAAASVIAMLNRERPQNIMQYLQALDDKQMYGTAVWDMFWQDCGGSVDEFVKKLGVPGDA